MRSNHSQQFRVHCVQTADKRSSKSSSRVRQTWACQQADEIHIAVTHLKYLALLVTLFTVLYSLNYAQHVSSRILPNIKGTWGSRACIKQSAQLPNTFCHGGIDKPKRMQTSGGTGLGQAAAAAAAGGAGASRRQLLLSTLASAGVAGLVGATRASAEIAPPPRTDMPMGEEGRVFLLTDSDAQNLSLSERQILLLNQRIQTQNRVTKGFPSFIRSGFDVKVIAPGYSITPEGIIYKDFKEGTGSPPVEGQEVVFNYTGYNESGTPIDSSYRQNRPAQAQLGMAGLIPGFDLALRTMKLGTQRRFIVPPALGPPVGPSTFFSAKQCEVFDVELLAIRTCSRQQIGMFSKMVCE